MAPTTPLCHGDLGNLDFLLQASQATGGLDLAHRLDELTNQVFASMKKYGWLCGVPLSVESPALMNGLAGICYGLLRIQRLTAYHQSSYCHRLIKTPIDSPSAQPATLPEIGVMQSVQSSGANCKHGARYLRNYTNRG